MVKRWGKREREWRVGKGRRTGHRALLPLPSCFFLCCACACACACAPPLVYPGPGRSYAALAGTACSRAVTLPSLNPKDITDDVSDFSPAQQAQLAQWVAFFEKKYPVVATLELSDMGPQQRQELRDRRRQPQPKTRPLPRQGRVFTLSELASYDGVEDSQPIFVALGGRVFDVSESRHMYGPGMPRHCYAGKSVTFALARGSIQAADIARGDDVQGLSAEELKTLHSRLKYFMEKYNEKGTLEGAPVLELVMME